MAISVNLTVRWKIKLKKRTHHLCWQDSSSSINVLIELACQFFLALNIPWYSLVCSIFKSSLIYKFWTNQHFNHWFEDKHKEGLRTLVESLVQMTCSDFTNFLKLTEFTIWNAFSEQQPNQNLDLTNFFEKLWYKTQHFCWKCVLYCKFSQF